MSDRVISGFISLLCLVGTSIDIVQRLMTNEGEEEEDKMVIIYEDNGSDADDTKQSVDETGKKVTFIQKHLPQISMHTVEVDSSSRWFLNNFMHTVEVDSCSRCF